MKTKLINTYFQVTKEFHFCYGHRLMNYKGKCMHLHGHNGRVLITLSAKVLDKRGMVIDFTKIKRDIRNWINEKLDHKMILRLDDPLAKLLRDLKEPLFLMKDNPTAENIAKLIFDFAKKEKLPVTQVQFWETASSCATFSQKQLLK